MVTGSPRSDGLSRRPSYLLVLSVPAEWRILRILRREAGPPQAQLEEGVQYRPPKPRGRWGQGERSSLRRRGSSHCRKSAGRPGSGSPYWFACVLRHQRDLAEFRRAKPSRCSSLPGAWGGNPDSVPSILLDFPLCPSPFHPFRLGGGAGLQRKRLLIRCGPSKKGSLDFSWIHHTCLRIAWAVAQKDTIPLPILHVPCCVLPSAGPRRRRGRGVGGSRPRRVL